MRLLVLTALTMTAFAANSVLNRAALAGHHADWAAFAAIRVSAGAVVLCVLSVVRRDSAPTWTGPTRLGGAASLALYIVGFSAAYLSLSAGYGALILFGGVQITMFAGALLLSEPVPARRWAGAALAFLGLVVLLWPGGTERLSLFPALSMAVAAVGWGVYSLLGRGASDPLGETAANFLWATLPCHTVAALAWTAGQGLNVDGTGVLLALVSGGITSGLGYALWYSVLPDLGAARAAVAQLTAPVIAAAGGAALLGETPGLRFVLAAALVLGGVAIGTFARRPVRSVA